jgi:hypothetical protein
MKTFINILLFSNLLIGVSLFAHGGNKHTNEIKVVKQDVINEDRNKIAYEKINKNYLKNIKPIFEKKCFDCHGSISNYPWYYKVPGVKQMMDYDMKEAKKHLDMSKDFPFISHETPLKDLKSLREVGLKNTMPPLRYILGHWDSSLSQEEKQRIIKWSEDSISILKGEGNE